MADSKVILNLHILLYYLDSVYHWFQISFYNPLHYLCPSSVCGSEKKRKPKGVLQGTRFGPEGWVKRTKRCLSLVLLTPFIICTGVSAFITLWFYCPTLIELPPTVIICTLLCKLLCVNINPSYIKRKPCMAAGCWQEVLSRLCTTWFHHVGRAVRNSPIALKIL